MAVATPPIFPTPIVFAIAVQAAANPDITEDIFDNVDTETMMNPENAAALCIMEHIARKRGCIKKGSDIDYEKCAACILDDFREGKIGNISLERP